MPRSSFEPIRIPDHAWRQDSVRRSLRERRAGELFRFAQKYGVSQMRLAALTGQSQGRINDLIHGRRGNITAIDAWERIADGLNMPDDARIALGLAPTRSTETANAGKDDLSARITYVALPDLVGGNADDNSLVAAELNTSIDQLRKWDVQRTVSRSILQISALGIGLDQIQELEATAEAFRSWDHQFGGGLRRKAVIGQLTEITDLLSESNPSPIYRRLAAIASRLAMTAAQMCGDTGRNSMAFSYLGLALQAAREAGDHALGARVANSIARRHLDSGNHATALEIIQQCKASLGSRLTADIKALISTTEAWVHAHQGDENEVRRSLDDASLTLTGVEPSSLFGRAEFAGVSGACFEVLALNDSRNAGRYLTDAERHIREALELRDAVYVRSRALDYVGLANVRVAQGEPEAACIEIRRAIDLARSLRSPRVANRIHRLTLGALDRFPDNSDVWELADEARLRLPVTSTTRTDRDTRR